MAEQKRLVTITFMDGTSLRFEFPVQVNDPWGQIRKFQAVLDRPQFCIQTEDGLMIFPTANIKSIQLSGVTAVNLPEFVVRNATLLQS